MGLDAHFFLVTADPMSDEQFAELEVAVEAQDVASPHLDRPDPDRVEIAHLGVGHLVHIRLMDRYYGLDYARGPWPKLRSFGDWLMLRFGETAQVLYGCDWHDAGCPWPTERQECEQVWVESGHLTYRREMGCDCDHCSTLAARAGAAS